MSFVFHPSFGVGGERRVFTYHIDAANGDTVLLSWTMSAADDSLSGRTEVLRVSQPFGNHQGAWLGFSPFDSYLYVTLGDGGSSNDAAGVGQNKRSLVRLEKPCCCPL